MLEMSLRYSFACVVFHFTRNCVLGVTGAHVGIMWLFMVQNLVGLETTYLM